MAGGALEAHGDGKSVCSETIGTIVFADIVLFTGTSTFAILSGCGKDVLDALLVRGRL